MKNKCWRGWKGGPKDDFYVKIKDWESLSLSWEPVVIMSIKLGCDLKAVTPALFWWLFISPLPHCINMHTKCTFDWKACNDLEAGADRGQGNIWWLRGCKCRACTSEWLMNAASSQASLYTTFWWLHLHPACSSQQCTSAYGPVPSIEENSRVIGSFYKVEEAPPHFCGYWSGALCFVCWFGIYLRLLLLEKDPLSDLDSADPIKRCE